MTIPVIMLNIHVLSASERKRTHNLGQIMNFS